MKIFKYFFLICLIWLFLNPFLLEAKKKSARYTKKFGHNLVYLPHSFKLKKPKKISITKKGVVLTFYSKKFAQGEAFYVEIKKKSPKDQRELFIEDLKIGQKKIFLTAYPWGWRGLGAISPKTKPGYKKGLLKFSLGSQEKRINFRLKTFKTKFKLSKRALDLKSFSDVDFQKKPAIVSFIKKCSAKKKKVFKKNSLNFLNEKLSHPRNRHYITSPFWATRVIERYRIKNNKKIKLKNRVKIHRGLDLRGKKGEPVYALGSGKIVLAEKLHYEGNMIIIDHGRKIFSYYMHLSSLNVEVGQKISGGDLIGLVGDTGVSTASHLHVSLMIDNIQVNPLSLLSLPIRN